MVIGDFEAPINAVPARSKARRVTQGRRRLPTLPMHPPASDVEGVLVLQFGDAVGH